MRSPQGLILITRRSRSSDNTSICGRPAGICHDARGSPRGCLPARLGTHCGRLLSWDTEHVGARDWKAYGHPDLEDRGQDEAEDSVGTGVPGTSPRGLLSGGGAP